MFARAIFPRFTKGLLYKTRRYFDLHQYQSKHLMSINGITVQKGKIATTAKEAQQIAATLSSAGGLILKSQIHAGGRGKGTLTSGLQGGVKVLQTPYQVGDYAKKMLGYNLITHQTTKQGLKVNAVLVHQGVDIKRQIYLAFILDRNTQGPALVASVNGGMQIQQVAKTDPKSILVQPINISIGLTDQILNRVVSNLKLESQKEDAFNQIKKLYQIFNLLDATQIQINPWATDPNGKLFCIDAKINIDDNAKFRQNNLVQLKKTSLCSQDVDPHQQIAINAGLNYVALDGNIGCMVNGAGLAMATMDIIQLNGGSPANFLDVGGGASVQQVKTAFQILSGHPKVKTILVNIFGAQGIIKAAAIVDLKLPLVVRLTGTNAEDGKKLIEDWANKNPNMKVKAAIDLDDAAKKAVQCLK